MRFGGFPAAAFDFYTGLRADNSRSYWAAHRDVYEDSVRAPLAALLDDLAGEFGGQVSLFRPFRDVRFARDKSPYKTHQGGFIEIAQAWDTTCRSTPTGCWSAAASTPGTRRTPGSTVPPSANRALGSGWLRWWRRWPRRVSRSRGNKSPPALAESPPIIRVSA